MLVVFVRSKDDVTKAKDRKGELRKNLKEREPNVMGRYELTTGDKGNVETRIISINKI